MPERKTGLCWRLDSRRPEDVAAELQTAKANYVVRLGGLPRTAFVGKDAMTLIVKAIVRQDGENLISETKRYIAGLHVMSGGSMLPYDILLTEDLV